MTTITLVSKIITNPSAEGIRLDAMRSATKVFNGLIWNLREQYKKRQSTYQQKKSQQDYEGTGITVEVAKQLQVPRLIMVVNKCPSALETEAVKLKVEEAYKCEVAAVIPHSDEMMNLASSGLFVIHYPDHPVTELYKNIAANLTA